MTSATETALVALAAAIAAAAAEDDAPLPPPWRNRGIDTALDAIAGGGATLILRDGETTVLEELLGGADDGVTESYELVHAASLEWIVENTAQATRDAAFDAGLVAVDEALRADRTLGGAVSDARITGVQYGNLVTEGAPEIKSAVVTIALLFTSARPF